MIIKNIAKHIVLVTKHKWHVFRLCLKIGIPWRGLVHDLSKFSWTEFSESIRYYNGKDSPLKTARKTNGYSAAWIHHKGKNKHHYEYWIDFYPDPRPVIMPYKYVAEMICDRISAGIVYKGKDWTQEEPLKYFLNERKNNVLIHEQVAKVLEEVFTQVKDNGINKTLKRKNIKSIYKKYCEN